MEPYLYFGSLGPHERQFQIPNFVGLALEPKHDREIKHDLTAALPYPDCSIAKIQAQDVLEHLPFDKVAPVLDEIYRVLKPGASFASACRIIAAQCRSGAPSMIGAAG